MIGKEALIAATNEFESALHGSADLARNDMASRRKEAIDLRRTISEKRGELYSLGSNFFKPTPRHAEFEAEFSKIRSAMALHQASWPITSIQPDDPLYLKSAASVADAYTKFFVWLRGALR